MTFKERKKWGSLTSLKEVPPRWASVLHLRRASSLNYTLLITFINVAYINHTVTKTITKSCYIPHLLGFINNSGLITL